MRAWLGSGPCVLWQRKWWVVFWCTTWARLHTERPRLCFVCSLTLVSTFMLLISTLCMELLSRKQYCSWKHPSSSLFYCYFIIFFQHNRISIHDFTYMTTVVLCAGMKAIFKTEGSINGAYRVDRALLQLRQRVHFMDQHNRLYVWRNLNLSLEPQAKTDPRLFLHPSASLSAAPTPCSFLLHIVLSKPLAAPLS